MNKANKILLRGAHVLDPANSIDEKKDILIEGKKITAVEKPGALDAKANEANCLEVKDCYIAPGFIDLNARFSGIKEDIEKTMENSSKAALRGGFTSVALMPGLPVLKQGAQGVELVLRYAKEKSKVRIFPIGSLTRFSKGEQLAEIGSQVEAGAIAVADDRRSIMNSYLMQKALEYVKAFSIPVFSFPMDKNLKGEGLIGEGIRAFELGLPSIPTAAEEIMVERDIILASKTNTPLHFSSITSKNSLKSIARAKEEGLPITAETNPPYFSLSHSMISSYEVSLKFFPPLRSEEHQSAIIEAMANGTLNAIASMHSPEQKKQEQVLFEEGAEGSISFETTLPLALNLVREKKCSLLRIVEMLSYEPAKILGLDKKGLGSLKVGSPADLVVFHPEKEYAYIEENIVSQAKNSPFLGKTFKGCAIHSLVEGVLFSHEK